MNAAVHMVMGTEEAQVITSALGFFAANIQREIEDAPDASEDDRKNLMMMLSLQFSAENMHHHLAELLLRGFDPEGELDDDE